MHADRNCFGFVHNFMNREPKYVVWQYSLQVRNEQRRSFLDHSTRRSSDLKAVPVSTFVAEAITFAAEPKLIRK